MNAGTLNLLLQFYMYGEIRHCEANETFRREAKCVLRDLGLIDRDDFPCITAKGRAHVEALLAAQLPVQQWISPIGRPT